MLARIIDKTTPNLRMNHGALLSNSFFPNCSPYFRSAVRQIRSLPADTPESITVSKTPSTLYPQGSSRRRPPLPPNLSPEPITVSKSVKELLPLLLAQPSHYIIVHIHGKPYLVTAGDVVRLPFKMPGVVPGDIIRLNRAACIGSRDFTLKGAPYVDERIFICSATIMGTESEPMRFKQKTKRRNRRVKTVKSKHRFTILRISELKIKRLEEI